MKMQFVITVALAGVTLLPMTVDAQDLFRTGRPDYTRTAPSNWQLPHQDYSRAQATDRFANTVGSPRFSAPPPARTANDYRRLEAAWENYRREAIRYQQLYGSTQFTNNDTTSYPNQRSNYDVNSNSFSNSRETQRFPQSGRCATRSRLDSDGYERSPADFRPTLRPTLPPIVAPSAAVPDWTPYEQTQIETRQFRQRPNPTRNGQFGSKDNSYLDPTKTARRPAASFLDSWLSAL